MKDWFVKIKKLKNYPIIILFFSIIFVLFTIDVVKADKEFSDLENKYLEQKPEFTMDRLIRNEYTPKYEKYINEQFLLRNKWIDLKSRTEFYLGKTENNGIAYGKNGYLFDKITTVNSEQIEKNISFVINFAQKYKNNNIVVAIVPNSFAVMEDKIPYGLKLVNQDKLISDIYDKIGNEGNIKTIDIVGKLRDHSQEYIFYKTDHHWTSLGAYYGYEAIMSNLNRSIIDMNELESNKVEFFLGTYYSKAKKFNAKFDEIVYYNNNAQEVTIGEEKYDGLYDFEKFKGRDKYAAFLYGNNDLTVIKNKNEDNKTNDGKISRLLVIKDSFGNSLVPFLTYSYDEIYVVDLRANKKKMSEIMKEDYFDEILFLYNINNFSEDNNFFRLEF